LLDMRIDDGIFPLQAGTFEQVPVWHASAAHPVEEAVAEEVPVALEYNGISYAVMFATPADLEDFAVGFSLTEGIVHARSEVYDLEVRSDRFGLCVAMTVASERFVELKQRRRSMTGRTGCGLCGIDSLDQAVRPVPSVSSNFQIPVKHLRAAFDTLRGQQRLLSLTGAVHAAGWIDAQGRLAHVREDVGRHNALDKMLGAAVKAETDFGAGAAVITSRASYEMVHKAAMMNVSVIAAISAPTALAIRTARQADMTLCGFVRGDHYAAYSRQERIIDSSHIDVQPKV
jgi:FdhD protein